ncbi:MAG: hypothetical protein AAF600_03310 [Bacteroidota bacterium]
MEQDPINEIMKSVEGISRAKAPTSAFAKIQDRITKQETKKKTNRYWMAVAAAVAMIICSNVFAVFYHLTADDLPINPDSSYSLISSFNLY